MKVRFKGSVCHAIDFDICCYRMAYPRLYATSRMNFSSLPNAGYSRRNESDSVIQTSKKCYFYVCRGFRDRLNCECMNIPDNHTWLQLKEKVCQRLSPLINPRNLSLSIYDEVGRSWSIVEDTNQSKTMAEFRFRVVPTFNIEKKDETNPRHPHLPMVEDKLLTLKLCRHPMDRTDYIIVYTLASKTIGECIQQAQRKVTNQRTDHLYRWSANGWEKLARELDDVPLAGVDFLSDSFISFKSSNDSIPGVCGLTNLGGTCFMNSALQCLSHIPQLTEELLRLGNEINAPTIGAYTALIKTLWSGEHSVTTPSSLLLNIRDSLPRFTRYRQHDAQEFMNYFLHLIHQELTNERTLISELFHGKMRSNVECQGDCHSTESNDETFAFLPLPVDDDTNQYSILFLRRNGEQQQVTVRGHASTIGALISMFIVQCKPNLAGGDIRPVRLDNHRIVVQYKSSDWIYKTDKDQLALIELPEKTVDQSYVELTFHDRATRQPFRPPVFLVQPTFKCRYSDLVEQLDRIRRHLYSTSEDAALPSDELLWINDISEARQLRSKNDDLLYLKRITIEVHEKWVVKYRDQHQMKPPSGKPTLERLLADFFRSEPLNGDYYCSQCQTLQSARHKAELILPLPPVLIIQLKRFTYERYSNDKIDTLIEFPLENLDLREYITKADQPRRQRSALYRLVAVSNHSGSLTSGHYVTYGRNDRNQRWYSFNDERVEEIQDVVTKNAYILIYVKQ